MKSNCLYCGYLFFALALNAVPVNAVMNGLGQDIFPVAAVFNASATITYISASNAGLTVSSGIVVSTGSVGIGTASPQAALHVVGVSSITASITVNGVEYAYVPRGQVSFFNLAACPVGWTALAGAQGRYLVGLPAAGTLAGTAGTALSNLENRATGIHNHTITDPGHAHLYPGGRGIVDLEVLIVDPLRPTPQLPG